MPEQLRLKNINLVVLDIDQDVNQARRYWTILEKIKEKNKNLPVIISTVRNYLEDETEIANHAGMFDRYIAKPYGPEDLLYIINELLTPTTLAQDGFLVDRPTKQTPKRINQGPIEAQKIIREALLRHNNGDNMDPETLINGPLPAAWRIEAVNEQGPTHLARYRFWVHDRWVAVLVLVTSGNEVYWDLKPTPITDLDRGFTKKIIEELAQLITQIGQSGLQDVPHLVASEQPARKDGKRQVDTPTPEPTGKSKRGPRGNLSKAEKIAAYQEWQSLDRDINPVTLELWLENKFGSHVDGSLCIPPSTFYGWKKLVETS